MYSLFYAMMVRFDLRVFLYPLLLSLFVQFFTWNITEAADTTEAVSVRVVSGSATLSGTPEINVTVFYADDDNFDNQINIEWGMDGGAYTGSHTSINHPVSPYAYTMTPLDNNEIYQVRVTITDPDNLPVAIVQTFSEKRPYNSLIHNAVSTGSGTDKWPSGWGTVDGQYGEFSCKTCHDRKSGNIKRIRKDWSETSLPAVPAKLNTETIDFQNNQDGSAQYALDDSTDHTSSNRICEACHTATAHHRYNESTTPGTADHSSSMACINCHQHATAFSAPRCSSCHGGKTVGLTQNNFWPDSVIENTDSDSSENDSGEHLIHMKSLAANDGMTLQQLLDDANSKNLQINYCSRCHGVNPGSGASHYQGDDVGDIASFQDMDGSAESLLPAGSYSSFACSNIDCHNNMNQPTPIWYGGATATCTMCHTADGSNPNSVKVDPNSGLHYSATPNGSILHDDNFLAGGECLSCHAVNPTTLHYDGTVQTPDQTTFNFIDSPGIDIKLNNLSDVTDDTCAASCHSDNKSWYRFWSSDAFDTTTFDTSTPAAVAATIANPLPVGCRVCHGEFVSGWAEGTAHDNMNVDNVSSGSSHNSQNPSINPGAACVDCHLYPDHINPGEGLLRHENRLITLTDDQTLPDDYTPKNDQVGRTGVYCADCHENSAVPADGFDANTFEYSFAFPGWENVEVVATDRNPEYTCFSGANGCHGDTTNNWWPHIDSTDPVNYPNREGAHFEHGTTIGELLAAQANAAVPGSRVDADGDGHVDATQEDRNKTCNFCHPMAWNVSRGVWESLYHRSNTPEAGAVVTDVFGGYIFPGADKTGVYLSGNPSFGGDAWVDIDTDSTTGFAYQLEPDPLNPGLDSRYPLDMDGEYWQYLDAKSNDSSVRHGVCSNISCHSNSPFTPQWYGDEQEPGQITDLVAYTHAQDPDHLGTEHPDHGTPVLVDDPGTVHLYWTAPGDNGHFSGTAYEYEVYYSKSGVISDVGAAGVTRAGGASSVLRQGESQAMIVDGLEPGIPYWFAIVTKDQPTYLDDDHDDIYDLFKSDGLRSVLGTTTGSTVAHTDDVAPTFWGGNNAESHDTGGAINLAWDAARDHTLPLTYLVYWSDYSLKTHLANGGTMPTFTRDGGAYSQGYTEGTPPLVGGTDYYIYGSSTTGMTYQMTGLGTGVLYNILVRAEDGVGNIDDNTVVSMAMANTLPEESDEAKMAILSGPGSIVMQSDPLNPDWGSVSSGTVSLAGTTSVTFVESDNLSTRETWVQGISIDLQIENSDRKLPQSLEFQFGYQNGVFTPIGSAVPVGLGRRANRVMKIGLSANKGVVPANTPLAIRITRTTSSGSTATIDLDWGDEINKGQLLFNVQPINHQPSLPILGALSRATGGYIDITWAPSNDGTPSDGGQVLHYDIFGSADDGVTWPYIIGTNLTDADAVTGVIWDTVGDGLDRFNAGSYNTRIKIDASDGYLYELTPGSGLWSSHRTVTSGTVVADNSQDDESPAAVTINHVEPRPKQGAAFLHWIAVGNDGYNHGTRAAYYDIRYRNNANGTLTAGNWNDAATIRVEGEPVPDFAGTAEEFELLNMTPDTVHTVAIVTCDAGEDTFAGNGDDNCSGLSNVYSITSGQYYCGICHSTPPDEADTRGTHRQHGYTLEDCAKCHGDGTGPDDGIGMPGPNDVTQYDGRHYDGVINIGWAKDSNGDHLMMAKIAPTDSHNVSINQGSGVIYNDPDGAGGYNSDGAYTATVNTDSGRCMNFIGANANGCHGPFSPQWAPDTVEPNPAVPSCSDCHGDTTVARDLDPYGRVWDCNVGGAPSELVKASPPTANHGGTTPTDRYVGAHEKHLNASFRFAKGDSCRLCHKDTMDLGLHADGNVDVLYDAVADQDETTAATVDQTHATVDIVGVSCASLNNVFCHDTGANWAEPGAKCNSCHGMGAKTYDVAGNSSTIGHVSSHIGTVVECIYCHVSGHPQSPDGTTSGDPEALLINNNAAVGINYRSGGIHLRRDYPWGTYTTLAEICWGCHEREGISEWGTNTNPATGNSAYNFGTLDQTSWVGAVWSSGHGQTSGDPFWYKRGYIQSTHTANPDGTSKVVWDSTNGRYNETSDTVDKIRCSNCHDVHDRNLTPGDTISGRPYLRGTWQTNPYEEDGAPYDRTYPAATVMGAVPRGGTAYSQLGGYYIDQNNVVPGTGETTQNAAHYPTSGWTIQSSAGLCVNCHGANVDAMDQRLPGTDAVEGDLWLGTNGHSNSVLGGSFSASVNIFDYSHGRPAPNSYDWGGGRPKDQNHFPVQVPDMAYLDQGNVGLAGGGYRGQDSNSGMYNPQLTLGQPYAFNAYDWGATVDGTTTDQMYHQFSCSKCHNPHASRLPKLMITNCLDLRHNTWDDSNSSLQNTFTSPTLTAVDRGMPAAYYASAQNCHRFDGRRSNTTLRGGWNKVTPWAKTNYGGTAAETDHKGTYTPAYNTRTSN
jgi:predicted CxxxxCH...CXXCH cytochrome family protein